MFGNAYLTYTCITSPMVGKLGSAPPWAMVQVKTVEPATRWAVQTGVTGPVEGSDLASTATLIRTEMVARQNYGPSPRVVTSSSRRTVIAGKSAWLLSSTITLNTAWATKLKTKVRHERLWIAAIQVQPNQIGLWHVTIPDIANSLWAQVPQAIASIKVK